jgi:hypothetical protein
MSATATHQIPPPATEAAGQYPATDRPRLRDRLTARLRVRKLDLALAAGAQSDTHAGLALRAQQLTDPGRRRSLADTLRQIVSEAYQPGDVAYLRKPPCRARVIEAGEELICLANALAQPGPVAVRGIAQTQLLLSDGTGPLYNPASRVDLRRHTISATENLSAAPA